MLPKRLSILGVGLLGGSIGLATKSILNICKITGYGHRKESLDKAIQIGAIDEAYDSAARAVRDCDLVILCTPVGTFESLLTQIAPELTQAAIVTDVGSTKETVVRLAEATLSKRTQFVGSHPMAGSEKRGVEFARTDLFRGALCITTPTDKTNPTALEAVEAFWKSLGMRLTRMTPQLHDRLLSDVSHLPHAVAAALVAMQSQEGLTLAGKGFLDTTRVGSGDAGLWRDIFLDNRVNLKASLKSLQDEIEKLLQLLDRNDGEALREWLDASAQRREALVLQKLREMSQE